MKPVWEPGDRVVAQLPLTTGAAFLGVALSLVPVLGFFAWGTQMSRAEVDRGLWVPFLLAALAFGLWLGFALARHFLGQTLVLDWSTRVATIHGPRRRQFRFEDITAVTLEARERQLPRAGKVFTAQVFIATRAERLLVRHLGGAPSLRAQLLATLTPEARKLARSLGRQLD